MSYQDVCHLWKLDPLRSCLKETNRCNARGTTTTTTTTTTTSLHPLFCCPALGPGSVPFLAQKSCSTAGRGIRGLPKPIRIRTNQYRRTFICLFSVIFIYIFSTFLLDRQFLVLWFAFGAPWWTLARTAQCLLLDHWAFGATAGLYCTGPLPRPLVIRRQNNAHDFWRQWLLFT